jgi:hypothetical protein
MHQGKVESIERYFESLESWDADFGKVYLFQDQRLPMVGEESYLWAGLLAKSELRQLLDELFEHALAGGFDSWDRLRAPEGAASQR